MGYRVRIAILMVVFCLVMISSVERVFAGAWTVPKYKVWAEYYMKWNWAKDSFGANGTAVSDQNASVKNFRSWEFVQEQKLEYGITDWLNFLSALEWKDAHYKEYDRPRSWGPYARKHQGLTNVKLGAKARLMEKPLVTSIQGKFFIYPGYGIWHSDDKRGYQNQPAIGYGNDSFELRGLIGKTFDLPIRYKIPCYFGAETGYRWNNRNVCNGWPYFIEGGFWPRPWLLIKTELDGYKTHDGTGKFEEVYGIWRIGCVWQVFGDSTLRAGNKMFNIEFQYGMVLWGKNTNRYQEWIMKVQTQF